MFPYADNPMDFWNGYFASRMSAKKVVRDAQANLHASNEIFAKAVISKKIEDYDVNANVKEITDAKDAMLDWLGVYQHHDAISGTAKQHVADNYMMHMQRSIDSSNKIYTKYLQQILEDQTGMSVDGLSQCLGSQNDTILDCPLGRDLDKLSDAVIVAHNPAAQEFNGLMQILLPKTKHVGAEGWCPVK